MTILHHLTLTFAAVNDTCGALICSGKTNIPSSTSDLGAAVAKVMQGIFLLMGAIAVVVVMVGGLQYILSAGDPKKTAQAKETILYAVIGVVIALSAYAIVSFISNGLG